MPRGSWYSQLPAFGWFDPEDRPGSAAYRVGGRSIPDSQQGIALPSRAGLGKWFNVTPPGGGLPFPMQQTDIGPAKWTGRGLDVSAAAAHQMGYTPKNFPTDANWKVEPRDEPRGLGSPAGMPVQAGEIPDNTDESQTPYAGGPPPPSRGQATQGRKMPTSLMDMFQPRDPAGEPVGLGDAVTSRSNSLIGLGLGLLSPSNPLRGQSSWGQALEGFQSGAQLDARTAQAAAARRQHAADRAQSMAQHAADRRQAQSNFERQFARNDPANAVSEAQRAMRDVLPQDATPEQKSAFMKQWYTPKTEGNLVAQAEQRRAIAKAQGLDESEPRTRAWIAGGGTLNEEGKPLPAETAAAIAMGGKFLDEAPAIRAKIASGMATDTITGKVKTYLNAGEQGEVARKVKSGTEALLRALTGAGMGIAEAQKYVERYEIQPTDSSTGALSKFDQLQDELARREQEAFRGRGGVPRDLIDRRKAAHEAISKPPTATATETPSGGTPAPTAGRGGSAPQRPANVPQGSYYSPSRNQWKLPDGTIVDAAGRPI